MAAWRLRTGTRPGLGLIGAHNNCLNTSTIICNGGSFSPLLFCKVYYLAAMERFTSHNNQDVFSVQFDYRNAPVDMYIQRRLLIAWCASLSEYHVYANTHTNTLLVNKKWEVFTLRGDITPRRQKRTFNEFRTFQQLLPLQGGLRIRGCCLWCHVMWLRCFWAKINTSGTKEVIFVGRGRDKPIKHRLQACFAVWRMMGWEGYVSSPHFVGVFSQVKLPDKLYRICSAFRIFVNYVWTVAYPCGLTVCTKSTPHLSNTGSLKTVAGRKVMSGYR